MPTIQERRISLGFATPRGLAKQLKVTLAAWLAWEKTDGPLPPMVESRLAAMERAAYAASLSRPVNLPFGTFSERRQALGLSRGTLAKLLGVSQDTIARWEQFDRLKKIDLLRFERLEAEILSSPATRHYRP